MDAKTGSIEGGCPMGHGDGGVRALINPANGTEFISVDEATPDDATAAVEPAQPSPPLRLRKSCQICDAGHTWPPARRGLSYAKPTSTHPPTMDQRGHF